ncbi:MAG: OmpH family outer membrane protein [Flavobacteriales bacterium]|nr:OmpH family outer membrane protein [Flavobacteriales bacterium]
MGDSNNSLAKISLGINALLVICVIILFVKMPSGGDVADTDGNDSLPTFVPANPDGSLKIGYFNTDTLNANLMFVKDLERDIEEATKKAEDKMRRKQNEIDAWNQKWEKRGGPLSTEQDQYMREAQELQQDAMILEQEVQLELAQEQERLMMTHVMRISNFTATFAQQEGYDMILSYQLGQNLVYINPTMDCTAALTKLLNDDYQSSTASLEDVEEGAE